MPKIKAKAKRVDSARSIVDNTRAHSVVYDLSTPAVDSLPSPNLERILVDSIHPKVDKVSGITSDNERQVEGVTSSLRGVHEPMTDKAPVIGVNAALGAEVLGRGCAQGRTPKSSPCADGGHSLILLFDSLWASVPPSIHPLLCSFVHLFIHQSSGAPLLSAIAPIGGRLALEMAESTPRAGASVPDQSRGTKELNSNGCRPDGTLTEIGARSRIVSTGSRLDGIGLDATPVGAERSKVRR